jgi:hypothetical protein
MNCKCVFGVTKLTFAGDTTSAKEIKHDETKINVMINIGAPTSKKEYNISSAW